MFDFLDSGQYDLLGAFWVTVQLTLYSAAGSLIWGTLLAGMRVSPVPLMRAFGTAYVNLVRNTPLTVVLVGCSLGLGQTLQIKLGGDTFDSIGFRLAVLGLAARAYDRLVLKARRERRDGRRLRQGPFRRYTLGGSPPLPRLRLPANGTG